MTLDGKTSTTVSRAIETLLSVLKDLGWEPQKDAEGVGFVVDFQPPYIPVAHAYAAVSEELETFIFYLNFGVAAALERRNETAQLLNLANWSLTNGNFEMDSEDGFVRFRSSVCFRGTELSDPLIRNLIRFAMGAVERYASGIIEVMARGKTAEQAFKDITENA